MFPCIGDNIHGITFPACVDPCMNSLVTIRQSVASSAKIPNSHS
jgi:hypothetical protein